MSNLREQIKEEQMAHCPFCGGEGKIIKDEWRNPNIGYGDSTWFVCKCKSCGAGSAKVYIKYFNEFSLYTVEEFRNSNLLRAKEQLRYDTYLALKQQEAIKLWNRRVKDA